jgi:hypothetical protein
VLVREERLLLLRRQEDVVQLGELRLEHLPHPPVRPDRHLSPLAIHRQDKGRVGLQPDVEIRGRVLRGPIREQHADRELEFGRHVPLEQVHTTHSSSAAAGLSWPASPKPIVSAGNHR